MKLNHIVCIAAALLIASCKKDTTVNNADRSVERLEIPADTVAAATAQSDAKPDLQQLVTLYTDRKEHIKILLTQSTSEEANEIYDAYYEENMLLLSSMYRAENYMLEHFYDYFYDEEKRITPPDSIQRKVILLKKAGLDLCEQGEGYVDICAGSDYYYNIFKLYVTPDYKEFIRINADEDKEVYAFDAGLHVTFEQVSERVLHWETFLQKFPKTKLREKAIDNYKSYQMDYLLGMDNTRSMNTETGQLEDENIAEYRRFIAKNPKSFTSKLAKITLENTGNLEQLQARIEQEQAKYFK
ncbi:hypothetical protein R1T16_06660 [Flavobacterium sp. DG1-102-2]|uniref:hypothetical protein n=1 Tax=Flavobacterium sp. DG1-102-2 TaxID=3081663 RepID=UPI002949041B|nr:hypothetical protein [Flavobacterium sp. DG1-102-2]MDV6168100.1 hypothetical protein [Flavobacterium sp. DG1-102-2]